MPHKAKSPAIAGDFLYLVAGAGFTKLYNRMYLKYIFSQALKDTNKCTNKTCRATSNQFCLLFPTLDSTIPIISYGLNHLVNKHEIFQSYQRIP